METRVAFDALVVTVVAPELKRRGYRKVGLHWRRSRDNINATVRLLRQRSPLDEVCFTFDFEVRTGDVGLDGRIGAVMSPPDDVWWQVRGGALRRKTVVAPLEPQLVEHEIFDALTRLGDAIDQLTSTSAVHAFAERHDGLAQGLLRVQERKRRRTA